MAGKIGEIVREWLKKEGWEVGEVTAPDLVSIREGEVEFVVVRKIGGRLTQKQVDSFEWMTRAGWVIKIALVTEGGEVVMLPFSPADEKLRIPKRVGRVEGQGELPVPRPHSHRGSRRQRKRRQLTEGEVEAKIEEGERLYEEMVEDMNKVRKGVMEGARKSG